LLIAAVAQLCASWFKTLPAALGKPQLRTALTTLELMLMVALLLLLGPHGVEGAAIAYSATAVVSLIAAVVSVHVALRRAESPRPTPAVAQESVELTR
jgi:O-antigen/teichoic acid export membrane protein